MTLVVQSRSKSFFSIANVILYTRKKLLELGWKVMPHALYNPDFVPSDYHLFRSLQNHLNEKIFDLNEAVKNDLIQFFASKNQTFYESGIMNLTERWQKVIEQYGQYIIDKCLLFILMNLLWKSWKKRNYFVANPIYYIMHFEIPVLFVQSEQATWVQEWV